MALYLPRGGGWRKVLDVGAGYVLGTIPNSRYQKAPGNIVVEERATAFEIRQEHFPAMVRDCPGLTAAPVHHMLDRAREFHGVQLQDERMQALGRIASGLAHELNNPAAAAARDARALSAPLEEAERASRVLAAARLSDTQLEAVDAIRDTCLGPPPARSEGFTFMDREGVAEEVDVARGLAHTLAVLEATARAKAVDVRLETADDLPRVDGFGSELNQVWEKLIDNAIDAAGPEGSVTVTATSRGDGIVVRVTDTGPGIAEQHRARVFEPFFTTKAVGAGTGLGLDLARRIVHSPHGDVDFTSQPGRTVFRVRVPATGAQAAGTRPWRQEENRE